MRAALLGLAALLLTAAAPQTPSHPQHHQHGQQTAPAQHKPAASGPTQPAAATTAKTPRLKPSLQPADVSIDPISGSSTDLILTAPLDGTTTIANATLKISVPPGVKYTELEAPTFPATQDLVWKIRVTLEEKAPPTAKLVATLTYSVENGPKNVDTALATITQLPPVDLATSVKPVLAPSSGALDQYNNLGLSLLLANADRRTAYVDGFRVLSPPYVHICAISLGNPPADAATAKCDPATVDKVISVWDFPVSVKPGESAAVSMTLATDKAVIPGTYDLILGYTIGQDSKQPAPEIATAQGKITIGVPGVSDVLSLLGVPSFVLLPGVLSVVAFILIFTLGQNAPAFDWRSPKYLFFAVTLALVYSVLYPLLAVNIGGLHLDFVHGYNLSDAAMLWVGSILIGAIAGGICWEIRRRIKARQAAQAAALVEQQAAQAAALAEMMEPSPNDNPLQILQKLARHGLGYLLQDIRETAGGAPSIYLLGFGSAPPGKVWATGLAKVENGDKPLSDDDKRRVQEVHDDTHEPGASLRLWELLDDANTQQALVVTWRDEMPQTITRDDFRAQVDPVSMFRFDW